MLKETFCQLANQYQADSGDILWPEIEKRHSSPKRHYHNLTHLEHLLSELLPIKDRFEHWDAVLFALFYHDSVYSTLRKDNEEKSALLAAKRMYELGCPSQMIAHAKAIILATKAHINHEHSDVNFFTDADLSILGAPTARYQEYARQIRAEYAIYPDFLYNPGRKSVVQHFLDMPHIFKTEYFQERYEAQARINLERELK